MNATLDQTTSTTIYLLEDRIRRIEHLLFGPNSPPDTNGAADEDKNDEPVTRRLVDLERRFDALVSRVRVYADVLKTCLCFPLFSSGISY